MLGTTGGRFLGPSGSQPHRNLWPIHGRGLDFQTNGEVTESIFAAGYNTPPTHSPFMSISPLELVSKNFHSGTVAFSQANSIFVQSQTDFLGGTVATKKTETCFGRWEHGIEPLQIQVPPLTTIASVSVKPDPKSSSSARSGKTDGIHHNSHSNSAANLSNHSRHTDTLTNTIRTNDISSGCSRTIPISWTSAASSSTNNIVDSRNIGCSLLQIKREPCQVSEITTSNNLGHTALTAVVKIESHSPKRTMDNLQNSTQSAGPIPVGIAVARQRLQEHAQQQHQPKEINRFGIGIATDLGGATSAFSQNMFFTGTNSTMIPFSSEAVTMGVSNVQNAVRTPPTLWQYPTSVPVESMVPMPIPPVGFQLVRDPSTGQFLFLPTTTSMEPFQQAVVWPSYPQQLQTPHLLMPPIAPLSQQMQPPPLTPIQLLGTDYLGGATLHQHTQTHSTRLVALTSDSKRKSSLPNLPMPATLIKIEDCSTSGNTTTSAHHQQSHIYDPCKSTAMQTIATAVQTTSMTPELEAHHQVYFQSEGNLIQIAPHNETCASLIDTIESRTVSPSSEHREMSPPHDHLDNSNLSGPEVQDANIQTDTPVMSEDDNTTGADDCAFPSNVNSADDSSTAITTSASFNDMCHNETISEVNSSNSFQNLNNTKTTESSFESNATVTSSIIIEDIRIPPPETIVLSSYESSESIDNDHQPVAYIQKLQAPDISGLELLSNSIEAFEKKAFIKQEPVEKADFIYNIEASATQTEPIDCSMPPKEYISSAVTEPLGGLNLLCALAEQRFQEEVGQRNRKRSSSSDGSESKRLKKHHKDKHSSKRSSKKSKHYKDRKETRNKHSQSDEEDEDDIVEKNLKETFDRVKASYQRHCVCKPSAGDGEQCCREKCNFPTPEEVYGAMHTDMKQKLTAIAKEFQAEKRKLNEIKNLEKTNHSRESTPSSSSKSFSFESEQSVKSEINVPNICSSSQSETFQADSSKVHSDTESIRFDEADTNSSSSCKQRKTDGTNVVDSSSLSAIKPKSLVGYIFASKKRINDMKTDNSSSMTDETSQSDINSIKQEAADNEELSQESLFGHHKRDYKTTKHQSKHKKSKSKDRKHRRSSEAKNRKKKIDAKCTLTDDHLDNLSATSRTRVLTAMGGLFYAGCLSAVQPPDIYSVTLDGERGNRPHIMSREEILRDAILEMAPQSVGEIAPGTRLCAYWSEQYRCLYPGTATLDDSYDFDPRFLTVEFDDGDRGRIAIHDIRFLLSDYPVVDYDPNQFFNLGKRKQRTSQSETHQTNECTNEPAPSTSTNSFSILNDKTRPEDKEAQKERRRLKKIRKDKNKQENVDKKHKHKHKQSDDEPYNKHRKHKKRRKHKKHHHRDEESPIGIKNEKDEEPLQQEDAVSQTDDSSQKNEETVEPDIKEETMTEEETSSPVTESSGSSYEPGKKKDRKTSVEKNSKIAAFLPAKQWWNWSGKGFKRTKKRGKKLFFRTIQRGKETITVGDSAVFLSTGRPDRPYIGRIECMWETSTNTRVVRVKWYYHPEETKGCPALVYPGGLFQSPHEDENDVQTISHKCQVLPFDEYTQKYGLDPEEYVSVYDNNDTFYLAGKYDPTSTILTLDSSIPRTSTEHECDSEDSD